MPNLNSDDLSKLLVLALHLRDDPRGDFDFEVEGSDAKDLKGKLLQAALDKQSHTGWCDQDDVGWLHQLSGASS